MAKTNGKIKIERGVAPPRSRYTPWPFAEMKIGESFIVPYDDVQAARSAATHAKRRSDGKFNYITRKTPEGYRFWRIACLSKG